MTISGPIMTPARKPSSCDTSMHSGGERSDSRYSFSASRSTGPGCEKGGSICGTPGPVRGGAAAANCYHAGAGTDRYPARAAAAPCVAAERLSRSLHVPRLHPPPHHRPQPAGRRLRPAAGRGGGGRGRRRRLAAPGHHGRPFRPQHQLRPGRAEGAAPAHQPAVRRAPDDRPVDPYVAAFAEAGADHIILHPEAGPHLHRSLQLIRSLGQRPAWC